MTASYLQPNDYSIVDRLKPFNLPYDSLIQEITTKQQYWKAGADRVKSIYNQATDLDPKFGYNKEYLKNFMEEANKNLDKLTKSDLRIQDNSNSAISIFKPLYDTTNKFNEELLTDSQLNKHYQKQDELSNYYRTKDNGKEWNINNEIYYKDAQSKYYQDAEANIQGTVKNHFQNKKTFIPYYDGHKELTDIQEACKGASRNNTEIASNQLYMKQTSIKGCNPAQLKVAFAKGLSNRFKQQEAINGYAHYRGNEGGLLAAFESNMLGNGQKNITALQIEKAALLAGGTTKEEKIKINEINNLIKLNNDEYQANLKDYKDITKGDSEKYIKDNFADIAGRVHFSQYINDAANAFRTDETTRKISTNTVALTLHKIAEDKIAETTAFNRLVKLEGVKHTYDVDLENVKTGNNIKVKNVEATNTLNQSILEGKVVNPNGLTNPNGTLVYPSLEESVKLNPTTSEDYQKEYIDKTKVSADHQYNDIVGVISRLTGISPEILTKDNIAQFVTDHFGKEGPKDPELKPMWDAYKKTVKTLTNHTSILKNAIDDATKDAGPKDLEGIQAIKVGGITVQPKDFATAVERVVINYPAQTVYGNKSKTMTKAFTTEYYKINGVTVNDKNTINNLDKYYKKNSEHITKINNLVTEKLTQTTINRDPVRVLSSPIQEKSDLNTQIISATAGLNLGKINDDTKDKPSYTITMSTSDGTGVYLVTKDGNGSNNVKKGSPTHTALTNHFRGNGDVTVKTLPNGIGVGYLIPNVQVGISGLPSEAKRTEYEANIDELSQFEKTVQKELSKTTNAYTVSSSVYPMTTASGKDVIVHGVKHSQGNISYKIIYTKGDNTKEISAKDKKEVVELLNQL